MFQIGLKQGIEMLSIFKKYSAKTSILDDFNFYENREKSLQTKRSSKQVPSPIELYNNRDFPVRLSFSLIHTHAHNICSEALGLLVQVVRSVAKNRFSFLGDVLCLVMFLFHF